MNSNFSVRSTVEVTKFGEMFLNRKRIELLRLIGEKGSINAASREMKMSYQQAWEFVRHMNEISPLPLVVRQRGGVNGGGAQLTDFGKKTITGFDVLMETYYEFNQKMSEHLWLCPM